MALEVVKVTRDDGAILYTVLDTITMDIMPHLFESEEEAADTCDLIESDVLL